MPVDLLSVASLASGSVPGPKDLLNTFSTLGTNYLNQKFSEKMYERQRNDAIEFWNMQNAYNDPSAQMARFRNAGLNPHLIYGQGAGGGNAGPIQTPDSPRVNFEAPRFEGNDSLMPHLLGAADLRIKSAQADNLEVQNEVIRQDAVLRALQAERAGFDLDFEKELRDVSADAKRESLRKLKVETDVMLNRDAREAALNSSNLKEAAERMLTMAEQRKREPLERGRIRADTDRIRENIRLMEKEGILKDFEVALRQQGINPNDPLWARYVGMFLSDIYDGRLTPSTIAGSIWSWLIK